MVRSPGPESNSSLIFLQRSSNTWLLQFDHNRENETSRVRKEVLKDG